MNMKRSLFSAALVWVCFALMSSLASASSLAPPGYERALHATQVVQSVTLYAQIDRDLGSVTQYLLTGTRRLDPSWRTARAIPDPHAYHLFAHDSHRAADTPARYQMRNI